MKRFLIMLIPAIAACAAADDRPATSFVPQLIASYEAMPEEQAPDEIWSFIIRDTVHFYVTGMPCCDLMSELYDADGNIVCFPEGGITGSGDGRCPDFRTTRGAGVLVWRDPRIKTARPD